MKPFLEEVRRAFRLTFVEGYREMRRTGKSNPGFLIDPHLRRGFFASVPIVLVGFVVALALMAATRSFVPYSAVFLPATILANVAWFAIAARSRAKG